MSLLDTDHLCGICGDAGWPWRSFTRGHNTLLMDGYDGSAGVGDPSYNASDPKWEAMRKNMGYARSYALRMDLSRAVPSGALASSGYCLAVVGSEYLVFCEVGVERESNRSQGRSVEWLNPDRTDKLVRPSRAVPRALPLRSAVWPSSNPPVTRCFTIARVLLKTSVRVGLKPLSEEIVAPISAPEIVAEIETAFRTRLPGWCHHELA